MSALTATELLHAWERGESHGGEQRALVILATAHPELSPDELARMPLGQRDALLLQLRERTFGAHIACMATCPRCGAQAEIDFQTTDIAADAAESPATLLTRHRDYEVECRLPNSLDIETLRSQDIAGARQWLLERCVLSARRGGEPVPARELPKPVVETIAASMAQADPQAHVELAISCPGCQHGWTPVFDIASFFWVELAAWARTLLRDVHALASVYRWSEAEILAMSPCRRRVYLEMIGR